MAEDKAGRGILPVSHYFALVAPVALWGAFIKLNIELLAPYKAALAPVYVGFALLSAVFGAVGANARINLHRIMSYSSMYHFGVVLLLLSFSELKRTLPRLFTFCLYAEPERRLSGFYSLKSHGEYLAATTSLSGLAETRPYTTGALLVSLFSMIGLPPLAGFTGQLGAVSELLKNGCYVSLGIILLFLLVLAKAYLEIIKTAYFEHKVKIFDAENKTVLLYTMFCMLCIVFVSFNPYGLFHLLQDMFYVVGL